jgi:aminoglycoside 6'-N-acetyltransferase
LIGRGHGSAFIRAFVEQSFAAGAPRVVTDPNPRNARAIRAYAKAGFHPIGQRRTLSGEALLMGCDALAKASKEMGEPHHG